MNSQLNQAVKILEKLVSFDSISGRPTEGIVKYICDYLAHHGIEASLSKDSTGERANVFASIGPKVDGGVLFNGHTDVVPVQGQDWHTEPFTLTQIADRLHGRGSVDMKGFLACMLAAVPVFKQARLTKPIYLAFTFDEEIGGLGMPVLLEYMSAEGIAPDIVIVGEPTESTIVTGHKGGFEMRTEVTGAEVHSCDPTKGVNAIVYAMKMVQKIEDIARLYANSPDSNSPYNPPYTTFNVGKIDGGMARNATAGWCHFDWEIRPLPGEDTQPILTEIQSHAEELRAQMQAVNPATDIQIITEVAVPALNDQNADAAREFISHITGLNSQQVVSFASDAGYFSDADFSTVLYGPGSINRAHKSDEYITLTELEDGMEFLSKAAQYLSK
ncbi:MAG: acetylornithine deacetylase [Gammaproteobacteria bacterium]|nr:acetylornithine deacetylase [Gammaproteobacteria bacterium]